MNETITAVIGAQWGDEGKGKMVDRLARESDIVVRYQGGNNAGHTVVVEGEKYVLHLIPSGILHPDTISLIGPGLVVNLRELMDEIDTLREAGVPVNDRLRIARRAHVLFPFHRYLDAASESERSEDEKIGTTQKGIGPAYESKVRRTGLRMCDLVDPEAVREHCERVVADLDEGWQSYEGATGAELAEEYVSYYRSLDDLVVDGPGTVGRARHEGKTILFEGAQGTHLDIDFGTYPYVTSSNPTVGGVVTGSGLPGHYLQEILGVAKAYTTRVGKGPFPTELTGEVGEWLRERGGEFGATTGRPRRCGWLDLKLLRHSVRVNGFTGLVLSKLDILSGRSSLKVAVQYRLQGREVEFFPARSENLEDVEPVYETLPGWDQDITRCRSFEELPSAAQDYVRFVEDFLDVDVPFVSVGPGRDQLILR